jgi:AraC family transcriptional regulator
MDHIRLYLWPHRMLLLGPGFDTGLHSHHALQVCFGLQGMLRLRTGIDEPWDEHGAFFVPADRPHEFAAAATATAIIYVEAESAECAALERSVPHNDRAIRFHLRDGLLVQLQALHERNATIEQANAVCLALLGVEQVRRPGFDHRIVKCLDAIRAQIDQRLRLAALARAINVSESWLAHRFTEEVGVPLRRYILWQRLWRAVGLALKGATLTQAAHAAGLSDSAHLSRAFRDTFGVTPSFLFEYRDRLIVSFADTWATEAPKRALAR